MKKFICLILVVTTIQETIAQDRLGMSTSNYAGINGVFINPSSISTSKKYLDIQLVSGSIFLDNNFIYIPKEDNRLKDKMNLTRRALKLEFPGFYDEDYIFSDRYDANPKSGIAYARITGPSVMFSYNGHAFALQYSNRIIFSGKNVPHDIAKLAYEQRHFPPLHGVRFDHSKEFNLGTASWMELGFTYSKTFRIDREYDFSSGISIKRLWGYHGARIQSNRLEYMLLNSDSMNVYRFNGSINMAHPFSYEDNRFLGTSNLIQGKGLAFDLGFTLTRKLTNGFNNGVARHNYSPYQFRIGLSLLDVGSLHYGKNSRSLLFNDSGGLWTGLDSLGFNNLNNLFDEITSALGENGNPVDHNIGFKLWLPSAVSVQLDYNLGNDFYFNAFFIQSIIFSKDQLSRPSQVSFIPRYESKVFEIAMPLTLFQYREPRIGLALKLGFVSLGTDRLGSFFGLNDFEGFDFYFAIKAGLCKKQYQKKFNRFKHCY